MATAQTSFFAELRDAWQRAADAAGAVTRRYAVAGNALELRFAGDALVAPLTRALAHLPEPSANGEALVVYAWDSETTGVELPPPPWSTDDYREHGRIRGFFDERFQSVFQWGSHSLTTLDVERSEAVYWVGAAGQIPYFEMAAPLRLILHGWLSARGVELVHAAAVGSEDSCALLVGRAGSGKSWTTLAAAAGGLRVIADDYSLLAPGAPPRVASVYSAAKTHDDALDRIAFLAPMVGNPQRQEVDKAVYFLHEHAPDLLLLDAGLEAVLMPRRTGRVALTPASPAAALAALAPSTILQLPGADAATLARLAELVRDVPCYFLDVGDDLEAIAPTIATVLR